MQLEKIDDYRWLIPKTYKAGMLTDALIFASERLLEAITHAAYVPPSGALGNRPNGPDYP